MTKYDRVVDSRGVEYLVKRHEPTDEEKGSPFKGKDGKLYRKLNDGRVLEVHPPDDVHG